MFKNNIKKDEKTKEGFGSTPDTTLIIVIVVIVAFVLFGALFYFGSSKERGPTRAPYRPQVNRI